MISDISRLPEFEKDLKKLAKRYRTLEEDIQNFIKASLTPFHTEGIVTGGIVEISDLGATEPKIFKVLKFTSRSFKGKGVKSGIRLTYAFFDSTKAVEFIEIYYKGDQENEDRNRIKNYLKTKTVKQS
jgi:mRNA-degrading endonuclease RelE of RelBE toxin-antitoxin system